MSWECPCEGSAARGMEHKPGRMQHCDFCNRPREVVEGRFRMLHFNLFGVQLRLLIPRRRTR